MGIIEFISPKWAYAREAWRQAHKEQQRNYDAGLFDRQNKNWFASIESGEITDRRFRNIVRARSRDLERNSDLMNANIYPWIRNVIGKGFDLEAKTPDESFNNSIENLWLKWCKKDNCDVTGSQSFWEMARMAVRRKRVDGGILFIKCDTPGGVVPFKLQAVEVDELDEAQYLPHEKGNRVIAGVEYNSYNRAVGYWIKEYDIQGYTSIAAHYVPRERLIFYFSKTRPSQIREMPEMAATIGRIKEINGYIEAASIKERIAACLSVFIKKVLPTGGLGRSVNSSKGERKSYNELELMPGLITDLNAGDDIQVVNPGTSATNSSEFIKTMSRLITAGQGISYESATRDLSDANYSSARQATIEDEETFMPEQEKIEDEFLDETYTAFVLSAVMSGAVEMPADFWNDPDKYYAHEWIRKPKKWIDPSKEASANKIAIETGQKTVAEIWRENGRDYKDVIDDLKEIIDYAAEMGIKLNIPFIREEQTDE